MNMRVPKQGYAVILTILITAILFFLWIYYYSPLAPTKQTEGEKRDIGIDAIDEAKGIKGMIESRDRAMSEE